MYLGGRWENRLVRRSSAEDFIFKQRKRKSWMVLQNGSDERTDPKVPITLVETWVSSPGWYFANPKSATCKELRQHLLKLINYKWSWRTLTAYSTVKLKPRIILFKCSIRHSWNAAQVLLLVRLRFMACTAISSPCRSKWYLGLKIMIEKNVGRLNITMYDFRITWQHVEAARQSLVLDMKLKY